MGRTSNPMQEHHKKKRLKEMQKNKEQRIKARDEMVVQTKTVDDVQEEIRNLKRRKNLQPTEQQKLQRLEKELKLVKTAFENKPKIFQPKQHQQEPLTELDDPRKSVYYDQRMNPYGAPPPGRPKLYHQRGGGVTMDMRFAVVPGEEPKPPPPPPPPPPRPQNQPLRRDNASRPPRRDDAPPPLPRERPPPRKRTPSPPPPPPIPPPPEEDKQEAEDKPLTIPALPAPSKAVQRSRRGTTIDIWASNEEVDFERHANKIDLEADDVGAAAPKKKKKKKPPLEFWYQDISQQVQGPYTKAHIREWFQGGFFPPTTLVRTSRNETWTPIANVQSLQEAPPPKPKESMEDRIAALKGESSLQNRIAALKQQDADDGEGIELNVQDRIAALRATREAPQLEDVDDGPAPPPPPGPSAEELPAYSVEETDHGDQEVLHPPPPPPLPSSGDMDVAPYPTEEGDNVPLPYPVDDEVPPHTVEDEVAPYPVDDGVGPAPYPVDDGPGVAAYPVDEEVAPYPTDEAVAPYTVDEGDGDVPYPVDTAYPVDGEETAYPVTDAYPATDSYPSASEAYDENAEEPPSYPMQPADAPKKIIKVDKDVVAFLPSHLQNRKRKPQSSGPVKAKKTKPEPSKPASDDIDKFMEEIEGL
jgi:hypothetical protein